MYEAVHNRCFKGAFSCPGNLFLFSLYLTGKSHIEVKGKKNESVSWPRLKQNCSQYKSNKMCIYNINITITNHHVVQKNWFSGQNAFKFFIISKNVHLFQQMFAKSTPAHGSFLDFFKKLFSNHQVVQKEQIS